MAEELSGLEGLPDSVMIEGILSFLTPRDLAFLSCCSTRLRSLCESDTLWFPIFIGYRNYPEENGGRPLNQYDHLPFGCRNWHQFFCYKQGCRCVECKKYTPYIFKLTPSPVRLCERCEFVGHKYSVATESEAKGRYQLTDMDLQNLPFKEVKLKKFPIYFFLKSSLEAIAHEKRLPLHTDEDESIEAYETDETGRQEETCGQSDGSDEDAGRALTKQEKKALKKEHKRSVKREKRERRRGEVRPFVGESSNTENHGIGSEGSRSQFKKVWKTKREHVSKNTGYQGEDSVGYYSSQLKSKSPSKWITEREWIERELGTYAISALELA